MSHLRINEAHRLIMLPSGLAGFPEVVQLNEQWNVTKKQLQQMGESVRFPRLPS